MCNILCRSCTCSVKYGYSTNPTCGYRNTVDFHSQRLPIIKFSRLELDKPGPGQTHKTMFYNILPPTISVKDLKNKGKHKPAILKSSVFHFICTSACSFICLGRSFSFKYPAFFVHYSLFGWQIGNFNYTSGN